MWRSYWRLAPVCLLMGAAAVEQPGRRTVPRQGPPAADSVPGPGGGAPAEYQGTHRREVHHLLERARGWRTSRDTRTDGGVPPPVSIGCVRDAYVAAAVQHAWAAESYFRLRHPSAARMAEAARDDLDRADELCAGSGPDPAECETVHIWPCPAPE
jgi:hypothetical protein